MAGSFSNRIAAQVCRCSQIELLVGELIVLQELIEPAGVRIFLCKLTRWNGLTNAPRILSADFVDWPKGCSESRQDFRRLNVGSRNS
jgi:hypothetical protein